MGAIRGVLLVIVCVLFFIAIFSAGVMFIIASSLDYDNVKSELTSVIKNVTEDGLDLSEKLNESFSSMKSNCEESLEYVFKYGDYTLVIPCEIVVQSSEAVIDYGIEKAMEQLYYKEYDCNFWNCFREGELPLFLISEKARIYWNNKFYFLLIAAIVLAGLMFLLVEKKTNMAILAGSLLIVASFPFMKLNNIVSSFAGQFAGLVKVFFTTSFSVFIKMLILGIIVLAVGVILKLFGIGFKISNTISKVKGIRDKISKKDNVKCKSKKSK